jgi:hypothetical protein
MVVGNRDPRDVSTILRVLFFMEFLFPRQNSSPQYHMSLSKRLLISKVRPIYGYLIATQLLVMIPSFQIRIIFVSIQVSLRFE